jgi:type I restriction enzyme S subunit
MGEDLYRLGDGCQIRHGFAFKGEHMVESEDVSLPIVVNIGNFKYDGGFRFESTRNQRYTGAFPDEYVMSPGTLLLVMTCQTAGGEILGVPGRVPDDGRRYLHNQRLGRVVIARPDELDPGYLYYLFLSRPFNAHLAGTASGSKILHTSPDRIMNFRWRRPPIDTQRRIAAVLSAYDALIDNNTKRIRALEEMARAVYREWFVHFRYPGHEQVPVEQTKAGPAPRGWRIQSLQEAVTVNPSVTIPRGGEIPFVSMGGLNTSGFHVEVTERRTTPSGARFADGDTLLARITPCLENGKTGLVTGLGEGVAACGSTEFIVLRPTIQGPEYVYLLAREPHFRDHAKSSMSGATGRQRVQESALCQFPVVSAPEPIYNAFREVVAPMFALSTTLFKRNRALREARDLLLPKLLSGALAVDGIALP